MRSTVLKWSLAAIVSLLLPNGSQAQTRPAAVGNAAVVERALVALNAFESWAFVYTAVEADTANKLRCEPRSADAPHACYPGTIPPCIGCWRYVSTLDTVYKERSSFLAAEILALATLDSAVREHPSDEMLVGTLVFMLSKRGRHDDAADVVAGSRCLLRSAVCSLFRGYVSQVAGQSGVAALEFGRALAQLSDAERCELLDASAVLDEPDAQSYSLLKCTERAARDAVFWWLSDPSWLIPENDRYLEQVARAVGNRILRKYRGALLEVHGVRWYAGQIPRSDSLQNYNDYRAWVQHPPGPWRWWHELTRFGLPNAVDVDPGFRTLFTRPYTYSFGGYTPGARTDGCSVPAAEMGGCVRPKPRICQMGYELRHMPLVPFDSVRLQPEGRTLPERGSPYRSLYPRSIPSRYLWGKHGSYGCTRFYNTRARYQFTPTWSATAAPFGMLPSDLIVTGNDELAGSAPYREQYSPHYAPVSAVSDFQIARLPRGDSMLVLAVVEFDGDGLDVARAGREGREWEAALLATPKVPPSDGDMVIARSRSTTFSRRHELRALVPRSSIMAGIELLTPDTIGFARTRFGVPLSPWLEGNLRLSDLVLFAPDSMTAGGASAGVRLETILPLALPSLSVRENEPLGLYWEMELPSDAVATEMTVTLAVEICGGTARLSWSSGPRNFWWRGQRRSRGVVADSDSTLSGKCNAGGGSFHSVSHTRTRPGRISRCRAAYRSQWPHSNHRAPDNSDQVASLPAARAERRSACCVSRARRVARGVSS